MLHGVVDGEHPGHLPAGGVDVEGDVLARVLGLEVQELGEHEVGDDVVDGRAEEDDAVLEQSGVEVVGPLAATRALEHGRDEERGQDGVGGATH